MQQAEQWKVKLAGKELCKRVQRTMALSYLLPYLEPAEQICLQGLDHWFYEKAVQRAQPRISLAKTYYFLCEGSVYEFESPWGKVHVHHVAIGVLTQISIKVGKKTFCFQYDLKKFGLLSKTTGSSAFRMIEKTPMRQFRQYASLCNLHDQFIFVTGGMGGSSSVERYDIANDYWDEMPSMNVDRWDHGSCTIDTTVYVLCGNNDRVGRLNSIEKLETRDLHTRDRQAGWQLIQMPPQSLLTERRSPVVAPLNSHQILIIGGSIFGGYLADVLTFDTRTDSVNQVARQAPSKLSATWNESIQVSPGVVVACVYSPDEDEGNDTVKLIKYQNGVVSTLAEFELC